MKEFIVRFPFVGFEADVVVDIENESDERNEIIYEIAKSKLYKAGFSCEQDFPNLPILKLSNCKIKL